VTTVPELPPPIRVQVQVQAQAQAQAVQTLDPKQSAHNLLLEGNSLVKQKRWAEAEAPFEASWALNPTVEVAFNLGSLEAFLGKPTEAAEHLSFAIRAWPVMDTMAPLFPIAQRLFAQSKQAIGVLKVEVNVAEAEVLVDGAAVGKAPLRREIFLMPGEHTIEARLKGHAAVKETVSLDKGTEKTVHLTFAQAKQKDGKASAQPARSESGDAAPVLRPAKDDAASKPRREIVIAGVATSAAAITVGAVFAIVSSAKAGDANDLRATLVERDGAKACSASSLLPNCRDLYDAMKTKDTFGNLATWGFVAGGLLGAGTAVYALASPKWAQTSRLRPLPVATAKGAGLLLVGEW
jgi:hypothetical protein